MDLYTLRCKRVDRTPVLWRRSGVTGLVTRVARDGTWADMVWHQWDRSLYWRKRQPLDCLAEWEHA